MLFNLVFANNTMLSCFFFFFLLMVGFLIPAVIPQIFNPSSEIAMPIGIATKETKVERETHLFRLYV